MFRCSFSSEVCFVRKRNTGFGSRKLQFELVRARRFIALASSDPDDKDPVAHMQEAFHFEKKS